MVLYAFILLFNNNLINSGCIQCHSRMVLCNELECMCQEAITLLLSLSQHLPVGTNRNQEIWGTVVLANFTNLCNYLLSVSIKY